MAAFCGTLRAMEEIHNRLLLAMPRAGFARLKPSLEAVSLRQGQQIDRLGEPVRHNYFVDCGFISMIKTMQDGRSVEVGGVGVEGLTSPSAVLALDTAALDSVVQIPGHGFRIKHETLKRELEHDPILLHLIQNYARYLLSQVAQTAACNRLHSVEERCCRWLLVAHDNALSDRFPLTQEFLATMLGAQRAGVSLAARMLKKAGLVNYSRGQVQVLDRKGLEQESCECYRAGRTELDALFSGRRSGGARLRKN
jgi:CRP-like cAMP-binding protein